MIRNRILTIRSRPLYFARTGLSPCIFTSALRNLLDEIREKRQGHIPCVRRSSIYFSVLGISCSGGHLLVNLSQRFRSPSLKIFGKQPGRRPSDGVFMRVYMLERRTNFAAEHCFTVVIRRELVTIAAELRKISAIKNGRYITFDDDHRLNSSQCC